ncbi:hypothetical protein PsYK624_147630 [Phanerochaete sordida]|uniref:Uncharacterized protein n=1 Tax=Phanerochaete sordida TaxID=48140 RepID=A0A9P3LKH5_9APHY|nr:hypothetical protein PsYK624_147630 [Phanerochaete sordida]
MYPYSGLAAGLASAAPAAHTGAANPGEPFLDSNGMTDDKGSGIGTVSSPDLEDMELQRSLSLENEENVELDPDIV